MKLQRCGDLMTAIARLPLGYYVKFDREVDEEDGVEFLGACVFETAPEDGWPSRGAFHGHPPDSPTHQQLCPEQWRDEPHVLFGVTSDVDEPEVLERLLINAIEKRWP